MHAVTAEELAELLGNRAEDSVIERIVLLGASVDEVCEALGELDYETRFNEPCEASSQKVDELRNILESLPYFRDARSDDDDELPIHETDKHGQEHV